MNVSFEDAFADPTSASFTFPSISVFQHEPLPRHQEMDIQLTNKHPKMGRGPEAKPRTQSPLLRLPNEILQRIAVLLPADKDVANLGLVCKEMRDRVLAPESAMWRARFGHKYDLPSGRSNSEFHWEYKIRALVVRQPIDFRQEKSEHQTMWLNVLQQMVLEALTLPLKSAASKTYERIQDALTKSELLEHPLRESPSELFCAVQLCLTSFALMLDPIDGTGPAIKNKCARTEYDIGAVYSHGQELTEPFIDHEHLDLATLLHMRSFWSRHMLSRAEQTYRDSFDRLPDDWKPQARKTDASQEAQLSVSWLGYYSCLHPMPATRSDFGDQETCADLRGDHLTQVEVMSLELAINPDEPFWPEQCSRIMPLYGGTETPRTFFHGFQSTLNGDDGENPVFGFSETIAHHYGNIPGWTRICFAICEATTSDDEGEAFDDGDPDGRWVHGYEGVILPGGRIMLGRWIDMKNMGPSGRGPFIFWDI